MIYKKLSFTKELKTENTLSSIEDQSFYKDNTLKFNKAHSARNIPVNSYLKLLKVNYKS